MPSISAPESDSAVSIESHLQNIVAKESYPVFG